MSGLAAAAGAQPVDLGMLLPPIATALGALVVLLADVLRPGGGRGAARPARWAPWLVGAALAVAAVRLLLLTLADSRGGTFCLADEPAVCSYGIGGPTLALQWLVLGAGALVVVMSSAEVTRRRLPAGEYYFLLLSSITGALVVVAARDLATAVVSIETVTLPLVALVALARDARGGQAALSLYLSSVVSLAVSLYGVALLYTAAGTLYYVQLADYFAHVDRLPSVGMLGAVLVLGVFVFKVAAVPFQAWAPDAYAASPVPVAAYLSVVSKAAGMGALLVLLTEGLLPLARWWGLGLAAVTAATFVVGNAIALRQASLVRLLAWSSVAQLAYVLLPVAAVGLGSVADIAARAGSGASGDGVSPLLGAAMADAVSASVAYLVAYALMTLASWAVVLLVVRRRRPAGGVLLIEDVRGLARRAPWAGGSLAFAFACLAGLPPGIVGLVVKVRVFQVAVAAQSWLLVAIAVVATVVALAYYLRVAAVLLAAPRAAPVLAPAVGIVVGTATGGRVEVAGEPASAPPRDGAEARDPLGLVVAVAVTTTALVVTSVAPALVLGWT